MTKKEIKEFRDWCNTDCVGIGVGLPEYIKILEVKLDVAKEELLKINNYNAKADGIGGTLPPKPPKPFPGEK